MNSASPDVQFSAKIMMNRPAVSLRDRLKFLWIEFKISSPSAIWLLPLLTAGGLLLLLSDNISTEPAEKLFQISIVIEIIFPLVIMFVANGLILREQEENQLDLLGTRSSLAVLYMRRLVVLLIVGTVWLCILLLIYHFFYLPLSLGMMILTSLSTTLALVGISNFVSLLLKEINAGYLIGTLWWAFCLISHRNAYVILGPRFYLFCLWFSLREDIEIENFILNKLALGGIGLVFIVVSVLLLRSRERYFL